MDCSLVDTSDSVVDTTAVDVDASVAVVDDIEEFVELELKI